MPIRGDRLRWPPRPGKKSSDPNGTRRARSTNEATARTTRRPEEPDESAKHQTTGPHGATRQAHSDSDKPDRHSRNMTPALGVRSTPLDEDGSKR